MDTLTTRQLAAQRAAETLRAKRAGTWAPAPSLIFFLCADGSVKTDHYTLSVNDIKRAAYRVGGSEHYAELLQAMYASLYLNPPTTAQDTPAKLRTRMVFAAQTALHQHIRYQRRHVSSVVIDRDGEALDWFDHCPGDDDVEGDYSETETQAQARQLVSSVLPTLAASARTVAALLMRGLSKTEVAAELRVSKAYITRQVAIIRSAIQNTNSD